MKLRIWLATLIVTAMLALVACGGADDSNDEDQMTTADYGGGVAISGSSGAAESTSRESAAAPSPLTATGAPQSDDGARPQPGDTGGDGDAGPVSLQVIAGSRDIIYTSYMVVVVEDVALATRQAQTQIAGLGGLVYGQDTTTSPSPRTTITFKVRPEDFQTALDRLAALGDLETQQTSADDVTDRVVDLESRIITSEASVQRLRGFLENATDLETVASLERELLSRETDLELLRGQLRTVQDQVALATIFLTLIEPDPPMDEARVELTQTAYLDTDEGARCPADDELTVDEGNPYTICISVENTGNLTLTEIELRDGGLKLDEKDFVVLEGSLDSLEPEQRLVGYFDVTAELGRYTSPSFSAVVVDEDGDPIRIPIAVDQELVEFHVIEDTSIPGFTDGLADSWDALLTMLQVGMLALGVLVPFIWVPVLAIAGIGFARRRLPRRERTVRVERTEYRDDDDNEEDTN